MARWYRVFLYGREDSVQEYVPKVFGEGTRGGANVYICGVGEGQKLV